MARHGRSPRRSLGLAVGALLLAGATLTACGGSSNDNGDGATGSGAASASGTATTAGSYPTGVPSGVSLTSPGKALQVGQSATVAWQPSQQLVGVLDLTVTAMHSTTFAKSFKGWELDDATKANAPYFVTATVRNAGQSDLAGQPVPLYGSAATGALVEASTFATDFKPCGPSVLPTPFPAGASAKVCLVYLVPHAGSLDGVSFRPTEAFDPITWSGEVTPLGKAGASSGTPSSGAPSGLPTSSPTAGGSPDVHMSGSPLH
ncbi:hypothetical protein [Nocardioides sp. Iso805N]|uniref:hypothetical protein n=1 Tax=Nocardioides sp. Iso805N TaxID=1283287 RepID=UPI00037C7C39|nr:hypothetical protein [Nocardioides sp. Iso805N]